MALDGCASKRGDQSTVEQVARLCASLEQIMGDLHSIPLFYDKIYAFISTLLPESFYINLVIPKSFKIRKLSNIEFDNRAGSFFFCCPTDFEEDESYLYSN
ncbi:hypothetical protein BpHYR1_004630 [Brachionus plicatilis]|uniref:Uncharacterized protein n=1 Tax=Brachionus plicatilis TaxID=10195 RepID=A0A3M7S7T0_BRAPC|nr:hypothetical protein BpHYR1_004630 [Brachionus plicatilis]